MKGDGLFSIADRGFASFLGRTGGIPPDSEALVARNFLLDEGVLAERVDSYKALGGVADHRDYGAWATAHNVYLSEAVFRPRSGDEVGAVVDPADSEACPETFRLIDLNSGSLRSDLGLHLVRLEEVRTILGGRDPGPDRIEDLAEQVVRSGWARDLSYRKLDDILSEWFQGADVRPVFAAYWEDVRGPFGNHPEDDEPHWADYLRDRMGLAHYDPGQRGGPIEVLVFRYAVGEVPRLARVRDRRPLVRPTVLDSRHFPTFCPAPRAEPTGYAVDLAQNSPPLCHEVLHPRLRFEAKHVWRVGRVERGLSGDWLREARAWHLYCVHDETGRADYATKTDADLLG